MIARSIGEGEHAPVLPEVPAHARFEDGNLSLRVQTAAVDDADAAMARATGVDESFHAGECVDGHQAVQVEIIAGRVVSALQLSQLTAIDARSHEARFAMIIIVGRLDGRHIGAGAPALAGDRRVHTSTGVRLKSNDIRHRTREVRGIGVNVEDWLRLVEAVARLAPLLHTAILEQFPDGCGARCPFA